MKIAKPGKGQTRSLYLRVLAPSLIMVCLVALLTITSVKVLSGVRAYVGGESMWSKARSASVQHLTDFAVSRDEADYARFEADLSLPLGDMRARIEMMRAVPDLNVAREGLLAGGNHPDDVDVMIALFRQFGDQFMFKDAVQAWIRGDELLAKLQTLGKKMRQQVLQGASDAELDGIVADIHQISGQLLVQEKRFSTTLASASRLTERLLIAGTLVTAILLLTFSFWIIHRSLKRQAQHQQALRLVTERWDLAANAAQLGLFELDLTNEVIELDARAAALHGLPARPVALSRNALRRTIHDADVAQAVGDIEEAIKHTQSFKIQYRIPLGDGQVRYLEAIGSGYAKDQTMGHKLVGIFRDTTDEHRQVQVAAQRDAAEQIAQAQREFLARLSHELRTPLNAILGFAQLLSMDANRRLSDVQREQVEWIFSAGQQLLTLVEDVLDLSKVEAGQIHMAITTVDVHDVLRESAALVDNASTQHQITIMDLLPSHPIWVQADAQRLHQVFVNLLTNGCKYNKPGGHVQIRTRTLGAMIAIDFQDNGIGLSPGDCERLFQPFKRANTQAPLVEGTGLGLYIVKQLVEHMAGQITLSSVLGQGSLFTVLLPEAVHAQPHPSDHQIPSSVSH